VFVSGDVGVPPSAEDVAVHGEVVADDVKVSGLGELVERFVDPAVSERLGRCAVVAVLKAMRQLFGTASQREADRQAQAWQPWRAYAVLRLWNALEKSS